MVEEAENLLPSLPKAEEQTWKKSVILAINAIENPDQEHAISLLQKHARHHEMKDNKRWEKLIGTLLILAGVVSIALCIAGTPLSASSSIALGVSGGLMITAGIGFWGHSEKKLLSQCFDSVNLSLSR